MRLSQQLPPLTTAQSNWARKAIFTHVAYATKQVAWCSDCGAVFAPIDDDKRCVCPKCGARLKVEHSRKQKLEERYYFTQLSVIGDYQVVRHYQACRYSKKGQPTRYAHEEVIQLWLDSRGNKTIVARSTNWMCRSYDGWSWGSPMEIRRIYSDAYGYARTRYNICAPICPGGEVLPIFRKRGYTLRYQQAAPDEIMTSILTDNNAETLMKQKQYDVAGYYVRRGSYKYNQYRHAVNIATRNGYRIKDASLWYDYLDLLEYFDLDTHNAKYVCPDNLKREHDRLMHRKEAILARERAEAQRRRDAETLKRDAKAIAKYKELKGRYFGIVLKQGKLHASVLPDVEAFMQEGEAMRHCVFTNGYYKHKDCLIFSVRNTHDKRVATVEFDLKTFKVVQCRGKANSQPKEYDEILKMFQAGAPKIQQAQQQSKAS